MHNIDATIVHVRSGSRSIARSVGNIAGSAATISRRLAGLDADVGSTHDRAARTTADFVAAGRAVASFPYNLATAAASLRALTRLVPSITQQASSITSTLETVDGHLVNINANGLVRLSNLLQLSNLLGAGG
jgi:ABC-type transporter Mla subunit MlaD